MFHFTFVVRKKKFSRCNYCWFEYPLFMFLNCKLMEVLIFVVKFQISTCCWHFSLFYKQLICLFLLFCFILFFHTFHFLLCKRFSIISSKDQNFSWYVCVRSSLETVKRELWTLPLCSSSTSSALYDDTVYTKRIKAFPFYSYYIFFLLLWTKIFHRYFFLFYF